MSYIDDSDMDAPLWTDSNLVYSVKSFVNFAPYLENF